MAEGKIDFRPNLVDRKAMASTPQRPDGFRKDARAPDLHSTSDHTHYTLANSRSLLLQSRQLSLFDIPLVNVRAQS